MITLESVSGPAYIFRVCPVDDGTPDPPFVAAGFLQIDGPVATIKGLNGNLDRRVLRDLLAKLRALGIEKVLAKRTDGHGLPFSTLQQDGYLCCDLVALEKRLTQS